MAVADFYSLHEDDDDIADGFRGFDFREDDYEVELEDTCLLEFAINRYNEDNDQKGFEFVKVIKAAYEHCCLLLYVTFEAKQGGETNPLSRHETEMEFDQVRSNPRITK
ncbi:hypothetical protein RHGRI_035024 [Rhododendron griersonianum]|uniref:Uncharacterized protein n=1 Tax=Rhododendron griersonianum TaxID=479676 RepID=A0AAV6I3T2_9ERIC|nr:hypothetical protein RHGRI_035024 [Rhododendron griersonianum]